MTPFTILRLTFGLVLLAAPERVLKVTGAPATGHTRLFARVLGVRHLAQAVLIGRRPGPGLAPLAAGVDGIHALTMLVLALSRPERRRPRLANAGVALSLGLLDVARARRELSASP